MAEITIRSVTSMDEWLSLSSAWSNLLAESNSSTLFLTWEWLYSWSEVCLEKDRQLFILAFYEKNSLVGVAPFYLQKRKFGLFPVREIRFLGTPESGSDYLDIVAKKGHEYEVSNALYDYLQGEGRSGWDQLHLTDIRSESLFLLHFMNRLDEEGRYAELKRSAYCPGVQLPNSEEGLDSILSSSWRKTFRRVERVSNRDYAVSFVVFAGAEVAAELETFFQLYEEKTGHAREPIYSIMKKMLEKSAEQMPFQIDHLLLDGKLVASLLSFKYGQTFSTYLIVVDKQFNPRISLGGLLYGHNIKNAISSAFEYYDFLKGDERYKFHWANTGRCTLSLDLWQKSAAGYSLALAKLTRLIGKVLLR